MRKKRKKAGWNIKNRYCALCEKWIPKNKAMYRHHISYGNTEYSKKKNSPHPPRNKDITKNLCYTCDCAVHYRLKFNRKHEKLYGKDFGTVAMAFNILSLYKPVLHEAILYIKKVNEELSK